MPECMVESGITRRPPLRLQLDLPLLLGLLLLLSPPSSGAYNTSVLQVRGVSASGSSRDPPLLTSEVA